jgi:hypothetical protein
VKGGVRVDGECAGGKHVEVKVDRVMVEGDEGVRPWVGTGVEYDGVCGWDEAGIEGIEGIWAGGGLVGIGNG